MAEAEHEHDWQVPYGYWNSTTLRYCSCGEVGFVVDNIVRGEN